MPKRQGEGKPVEEETMPIPLKPGREKPKSLSWKNETVPFALVHEVVTPDFEKPSQENSRAERVAEGLRPSSWKNETVPFSLVHQVVSPDVEESLPLSLGEGLQGPTTSPETSVSVPAVPTAQNQKVRVERREYAEQVQREQVPPCFSGAVSQGSTSCDRRAESKRLAVGEHFYGKLGMVALALLAVAAASLVGSEGLRSIEQSLVRWLSP